MKNGVPDNLHCLQKKDHSPPMKKDEESLLRMNFLLQAARLYADSHPTLSSHFLYDFVQMSEKKIIRIDKTLKGKIDKRRFVFRKVLHMTKFLKKQQEQEPMEGEQQGVQQGEQQPLGDSCD